MKHDIPSDLSPSGDICYPIFIPDDEDYRRLFLGAFRDLLSTNYYKQSSYDLNSVNTLIDIWRERTYLPFVQAMSENEGCESEPVLAQFKKSIRNATQSLTGATDTAIIWNNGYVDGTNPTRVYAPFQPCAISIVANIHVSAGSSFVCNAWWRVNGSLEYGRRLSTAALNHYFNLSLVEQFGATDYVELMVIPQIAATLQVSTIVPNITMIATPTE